MHYQTALGISDVMGEKRGGMSNQIVRLGALRRGGIARNRGGG